MNDGHYNRKVYWIVFAIGFSGFMEATLLYTAKQQRVYQSAVKLQFEPNADHKGIRDFGDMVSMMESPAMAQRVAERLLQSPLQPLSLEAFLKPYGYPPDAGLIVIKDLFLANRTVVAHPETNTAEIQYRHPDRFIAATIANIFLDECIAAKSRKRIDDSIMEVEVLKSKIDRQDAKVKALEQALIAYRNAHSDLSAEALQADEAYQSISKQLAVEQALLKEMITLLARLRTPSTIESS